MATHLLDCLNSGSSPRFLYHHSFGHACDKTDHAIARKIERVLSKLVFSFHALMLFTSFLDWVLVWLFYQTLLGDLTLCSLFLLLSCSVTDKWMSTSNMFWRLGWENHSCCSIWLKKNSVSSWKLFIFIWIKHNLIFNVFWSFTKFFSYFLLLLLL